MLNADDPYTYASLQRLKEVVRQKHPLILWIGAGASQWAGLPSWRESASRMFKTFSRTIPDFPSDLARSHISSKAYAEVFQLCRNADRALYHRLLIAQFKSPSIGPVYHQFIEKLRNINPACVVTTNVDLNLEQHLGINDVVENSDLERCTDSIIAGVPFIAKLHGSISSITSTVFTSHDYANLVANVQFIATLKSILSIGSVLFLGYGLQDKYLLKLISENGRDRSLFGNGPHFRVTSSPGPPDMGVHDIGYRIARHGDHRAALTVLDFVQQAGVTPALEIVPASPLSDHKPAESGFYICEFAPSGHYITGTEFPISEGEEMATIGLGFTPRELPSCEPIAFHDLAVGLLCFDRVFLPLHAVERLYRGTGNKVFRPLIDSDILNFISIPQSLVMIRPQYSWMGRLSLIRSMEPAGTGELSPLSFLRAVMKAKPGREAACEEIIHAISSHVVTFGDSNQLGLQEMVRDALLLPRVSELLGFSGYIPANTIPRWLAFPTLRLGNLVQTGLICSHLNIRAARVPFGGLSLLSAAFSVKPVEQSVYDYASYVVAGASGLNLSRFIERDPEILLAIRKFRGTAEGEALRREIADRLETNEGTEFSTAIEGALKRVIPAAAIASARNKLSTLLKTINPNASAAVIWSDNSADDVRLRHWREQSREFLLAEARARGLKSDSACLCGSGDRLRECCLQPLK